MGRVIKLGLLVCFWVTFIYLNTTVAAQTLCEYSQPQPAILNMQDILSGEIIDVRLMPHDNQSLWIISRPMIQDENRVWPVEPFTLYHEVLLNHFRLDMRTGQIESIEYPYVSVVTHELTDTLGVTDVVFGEDSIYGSLFLSPDMTQIVYFVQEPCSACSAENYRVWIASVDGSDKQYVGEYTGFWAREYIDWGSDNRLYLTWIPPYGLGGGNIQVVVCLDGSCLLDSDGIIEDAGLSSNELWRSTFVVPNPSGNQVAITFENRTEGIMIINTDTGEQIVIPSNEATTGRNPFFDHRVPARWLDDRTVLYFDIDDMKVIELPDDLSSYSQTSIDFPFGGFTDWLVMPETQILVAWDSILLTINCNLYEGD
jgi:hypothetical protein